MTNMVVLPGVILSKRLQGLMFASVEQNYDSVGINNFAVRPGFPRTRIMFAGIYFCDLKMKFAQLNNFSQFSNINEFN